MMYGADACLLKQHTSGDDLDSATQPAVGLMKEIPKEDL